MSSSNDGAAPSNGDAPASSPARLPIDRRTLLVAGAAGILGAAPPPERVGGVETIRLWPGDPPGSPVALPEATLRKEGGGRPGRKEYRLRGVAAPVLSVYRPTQANRAAILVMPGGGYAFLSVQNEGSAVARTLTGMGYVVLVLSYRLPGEGWTNRADAPLQDAARAMRVIRARAGDLGIDPDRIGALGFSAGGHLAASLATSRGTTLYAPVDAADRLSSDPAFLALAYAVTTLGPPCEGTASRRNLLGPDADEPLVERRSPLLHVAKGMAPSFLIHALDDPVVAPTCAIEWLAACRAASVPVEAHLFERGGHGFGVGLPDTYPAALWPELFRRWAARHGG